MSSAKKNSSSNSVCTLGLACNLLRLKSFPSKRHLIGIPMSSSWEIERKTMIRNRYNYPTPPIRDIQGKETRTRNNWTLMETSLAESQTDSYSPRKWPNGYQKQKYVSDIHTQRRTITKINHDRRTTLERSVKSISLGRGGGGVGGRSLNRFYVASCKHGRKHHAEQCCS